MTPHRLGIVVAGIGAILVLTTSDNVVGVFGLVAILVILVGVAIAIGRAIMKVKRIANALDPEGMSNAEREALSIRMTKDEVKERSGYTQTKHVERRHG